MRRSSSLDRPALSRTTLVGLLAWFLSVALLPCGVALADTVETNFEVPLFHTGSVAGQDGWRSAVPGNIPSLPYGYDQEVVANKGAPPEFGGQSLRLSNARNQELAGPPEFHFQTYSRPTTVAAGEGLPNTEYTAEFSFISTRPNAQQPGLNVSVSPDEGEGGRMSFIGLQSEANGIKVTFFDTPNADGEFVPYDLGTLPRDVPHTIKFWIKLNPLPNDDLVRIYIDGHDAGQCFTTWANFYRSVSQPVPAINTLQFRSVGEHENLSLLGGGYLFDNVKITTSNGPGPPGCDLPIEKKADVRTVSPGGRVRYRITVRNRGRLSASHVLLCDRIPREMTFVSADRKLLTLGGRRCLLIPRLGPGQSVSFHVLLRVDANAPPGTETNTVEETPGVAPPRPPSVGVLGEKVASIPPLEAAVAKVRIRAKPASPRQPAPPVTG
jgi:uncharacterized repeat protein (TIGR01451 family)